MGVNKWLARFLSYILSKFFLQVIMPSCDMWCCSFIYDYINFYYVAALVMPI